MRSFTENDPIAFLNQYAEGMLLDEVHHAPNLLSYIQGMVDEDTNRRFVLSGSSQFAMLKKITQSLARRTAVFELLPMSCAEIRKTATGTPLDDLLFSGFYPAICSGRNMPKFLYPAYVKTYLDKGTRFAANQGYDAVSYIYPALCRAHRLVIQSLGTGQRDRCQFPHDNGLAARTASALYRNPAAHVFREYTQAADQNAQALFHGYGAYLPSARHRIAGAARTGQDAGSTVRKLHRDGGIETAV